MHNMQKKNKNIILLYFHTLQYDQQI